MTRFKFTLDPVLEHRERVEDERQQTLALRTAELRRAQDELRRLDGEFGRYASALRCEHRGLDENELRAHCAHLEFLDRSIVMQHAAISAHATAVERARGELMQASKDRKVLENLKSRRLEEHRATQAALEQRELDESNARRRDRADANGAAYKGLKP